jgi:asparagine synthase (glutamine-hydrolysing)
MCGIAGFRDFSASSPEMVLSQRVRDMCDALFHRGPDGEGDWLDSEAGIALGHRRLAIVDLSDAGHQPMESRCGRYVISFNGEVYNFRELRRDLEHRHHVFRGGSDTEVMLAAISEWGLDSALSRFIGMFAFALWDRRTRMLALVRDRMGVKPLYWTVSRGHLLFGSELKALMIHPAWEPRINVEALTGFLRYSYIPNPATAFMGVWQVEPGSIVRVAADGTTSKKLYWNMRQNLTAAASSPFSGSDEEAVDQLDNLLRQSIGIRMIADVPLGAFLSGGIDSSVVAAIMQSQSAHAIRTFSVGFKETNYDEAPYAREVAKHLGTDHTEVYLTGQDALEAVPSLPDWFDEPFADPSQLPTYLVARTARAHVTVALSGDGGDELFAGYPRYQYAQSLWNRLRRVPRMLRIGLAAGVQATPEPWLDRLASALPLRRRPLSAGRKMHRAAGLLSLDVADEVHWRMAEVWSDADRLTGASNGLRLQHDEDLAGHVPSFLARMRYYDMRTYLADDILTKVDRASMAVSLEAREPLLDHRVVEYALRLPNHLLERGGVSKWILRRVLDRYLPSKLFNRPKMGFSIPTGAWLRGPLRSWAAALIDQDRLRVEGLLNPIEIKRLWTEHQEGYANRETILWNVLMLQAWRERYRV